MKRSSVNHPVYLFFRFLFRIPVKVFFHLKGYRIDNRARLPLKRQPMMIISNHAAFVDSVYFICAVRPRIVICGAKPKYFQKWVTRNLFRTANILMIESGEQFVRDCEDLLDRGEILLVYPEMGRNPEGMGEFKTWAAEAALSRHVPVLPCFLCGTTRGQEGPVRLFVGDPFVPGGDPDGVTERFRREIMSLDPSGTAEANGPVKKENS